MKKIYLDGFFSALTKQKVKTIKQYTDSIPNNCDIVGISFYTNHWEDHSEVIKQLLPKTKKLLINLSEPTWSNYDFVEFLKQWDVPRVYTFSDAVLNTAPPKNFSTIVSWFIGPRNFYSTKLWAINRIGKLVYSFNKPYRFDCLLGIPRFHRDIIEQFYNQSPHRNDILFTYYRHNPADGIWDAESEVNVSSMIPVSVYNQSYYSIVAETTYETNYNQYTEKVAKPMIGRRPFIVFAGKNYLKNLKSLGFQTFDSVINEDYDNIDDHQERFAAAWDQVEYLCQQDPVEIYNKLQPILEHNFRHFIRTDWHAAIKPHLN